MSEQPWPVGTEVAWYGPYDREPSGTATVEKVYKTGHIIVRGRRFRLSGYNRAHETGDGYSKASLKLMTPDLSAAVQRAKKRRTMKKVGAWLENCDPDLVADDALAALVAAMESSTTTSP